MEVRSALGPAITRAGGIKRKEDDACLMMTPAHDEDRFRPGGSHSGANECPARYSGKAQKLKLAQGVDIEIGRDRYDRDRRRNDATVGIGPGGVTIDPRQRCRMITTTIERGDRTITRRERRCDYER
jgi:hypothetical protein